MTEDPVCQDTDCSILCERMLNTMREDTVCGLTGERGFIQRERMLYANDNIVYHDTGCCVP